MEDDKGLDLSLALPSGESSSKQKDANGHSAGDGDRASKIVNDFKNFLNGGIPQQIPKPPENLFSSFSHVGVEGDASGNGNERRFWISSREKSGELEDGKGPNVGDKRKSIADETSHSKKQDSETHNSDLHDKGKTSHISITTDEGSTADNEDMAESETISRHEDGPKRHGGSGSSCELTKEMHAKGPISAPPFSVQSIANLSVPYSITIKQSSPLGTPSSSFYPLSSPTQPMPTAGNDWSRTQQTSTAGSAPMVFGYPSVQLASMDKDNCWGVSSRPPAALSYPARGLSASAPFPVSNHNGRATEQSKGDSKQPAVLGDEGGSSSRMDEAVNNISSLHRVKSASELASGNSFPSEYPAIKPGIAADIKFGGSGSLPNLPWVSTTDPGPNGRTISGVTYKFSPNQIKIVCACHGSHLSPDEFIRHASEEPPPGPDNGQPPAPIPVRRSSPAASAES